MKKIIIILVYIAGVLLISSCNPNEHPLPKFEDMIGFTIYDYIVEHEEDFSSFLAILEKGGIDKTLSAYNPEGDDYTLFLPDNNAINSFIQKNSQFGSLNDLLNNQEYVNVFSRYHVINEAIMSDDFPFGAFEEPTLSEDYLTVTFVIEPDTAYYKINNQAPVIFRDIETSNGYIHLISEALTPVTFTTYGWLELHSEEYSIFKEAVDKTGFNTLLDINLKEAELEVQPTTLLLEHDSVYHKHNILSFSDLVTKVSPNSNDFTNNLNLLYNYVGYHILTGNYFLDDFVGEATNYSNNSDIPVNINGTGFDIVINKGKEVFDTIVSAGNDTTYIDYIGFYYDICNIVTQSGSIHFINRMMKQQRPSRAIKTYQFFEEPLILEKREEVGSYILEDPDAMERLDWTGADLFYVKMADETGTAWSDDYLQINGDFTISYTIPKIVQGKYSAFIGAEAITADNALIEVFIDGKKVGGLIDLSYGGSSNYPFPQIELGTVDFLKYSEHTIEIKSLIPGRFLWDYIRFEPY